MSKESFPVVTQIYQKDAPGMYGSHFIDNLPFRAYHPAYKYFFESLPKHQSPVRILDVASGNENRVLDGMKRFGNEICLLATDIVVPADLGALPDNVSRNFIQADMSKHWPFPSNNFDGIIVSWALHWFGKDGSGIAFDETARVLKSGSDAIISTLTPFDSLMTSHVFLRDKIGNKQLYRMYPNSQVIGKSRMKKKVWSVRNDEDIRMQLSTGQGYALKNSDPLSIIGEKKLIGFTPKYLREEFIKRGLDIVMEVNKPNYDFPNSHPPTLPEGRTHLIYVVRKQ